MPTTLLQQKSFTKGFQKNERAYLADEHNAVCVIRQASNGDMPFQLKVLDRKNLGSTTLLTQFDGDSELYKLVRAESRETGMESQDRYRRQLFHFDIVSRENPDDVKGELVVRRWMPPVGENSYMIFKLVFKGHTVEDWTGIAA